MEDEVFKLLIESVREADKFVKGNDHRCNVRRIEKIDTHEESRMDQSKQGNWNGNN